MKDYKINSETIALIPINNYKTKVIEEKNIFLIDMSAKKIIEKSCKYFGSSYLGRHEGTKNLIGVTHKSPIIIEETKNIIYFPTTSPRLKNCIWISLRHVIDYKLKDGKLLVLFENGSKIHIDISYKSFNNQFLRATKLEFILSRRKI